jgi:peptidoglycan/LPS O-acetylase OafA/YrhL
MALGAVARYKRSVPARPLVFALGLLLCLAGAITCATAAPNDAQEFPSLSDGLVIVGGLLVIFGVAGREARARQLLGRRRSTPSAPPSDGER